MNFISQFENEPLTDFSVTANRDYLRLALEHIEGMRRDGKLVGAALVDGKPVADGAIVERPDPSNSQLIVGKICLGTTAVAEKCLISLYKGKERWAKEPVGNRAACLRRIASILRERKGFFTALIIREAGKPWAEADGDVAEAIDFCEYYAAAAEERLSGQGLVRSLPGESNAYHFRPKGLAVVIAPWNFPLAIACGMTVASLVAGNTTLLKPAEQTSIVAYELGKAILDSGVPGDAFALLPGEGETVGRYLVEHPAVDLIAFTGSKAVGLEIVRTASYMRPGQRAIKRVIAELGGKNAIIVDEDADLDEAIRGIVYSAFGFAGQKCSACSRVIVVGGAYTRLIARLLPAVEDSAVGPAWEPGTLVGPVIDAESQSRILDTVSRQEKFFAAAVKGACPHGGYYVPPTVFVDVPTDSPLWTEEIFGPVLCCRAVNTFDEALHLANSSDYALTGGVYSRSPKNIETARADFEVGNLYINRAITGALVGRQPFGGFRMSGVGSKAGGPEYLYQFAEPRTVTENVMRKGFVPEV